MEETNPISDIRASADYRKEMVHFMVEKIISALAAPFIPGGSALGKQKISFTVNNQTYSLEVSPDETLLRTLRERLRLTGTKEGCGTGECGACIVILNGRAVNSCLVLAAECDGANITTIEGLAQDRHRLHPLQESFIRHGAVQCGFCTPGMLMAAKNFLDHHPRPTREEIKKAISGNLCRCTGYKKIIDAIEAVVKENLLPEEEGSRARDRILIFLQRPSKTFRGWTKGSRTLVETSIASIPWNM